MPQCVVCTIEMPEKLEFARDNTVSISIPEFNTASGPVICGGTYIQNRQWIVEDRCWIHRQDIQQWVPSPNMKIKREQASAIEVNNDQTLIIGGINEKGFTLRSTELYR